MKFYFFHLMPYPNMPDDYLDTYGTSWARIPNKHFDPEVGHTLYNQYLDHLEHAETLGYDGICVNEHHQTCYGLMPAPNLMAASLARRTSHIKIAILGNALPLRNHPLRVAEEVAMLDVISGGRIISGFVRGVGDEYTAFSMDPTTSRERFFEAHDLIIRAWTEAGPFSFEGKHYNFRYVNPWPRPLQKPHPPVWMPGQGSIETVIFAAERRYPYMHVFSPYSQVKRVLDEYKEQARKSGYEAPPDQLGWNIPIYVAETDERAWEEAEAHLNYFFNKLLKRPIQQFFPPGYITSQSMARVKKDDSGGLGHGNKAVKKPHNLREMNEKAMIMVGSAATIRDRLKAYEKDSGIGFIVATLNFGSLPADLTLKNLEIFAKEVMPHFRTEVPAAVG